MRGVYCGKGDGSEWSMVNWGAAWSKVKLHSCENKEEGLLNWWSGENTIEWEERCWIGVFLVNLDRNKYCSGGVFSVVLGIILVVDCCLFVC